MKKPSLSSVKNTAGLKANITWKKDVSVTGYEVQYSTDKSFKSGVKTITVSKNSTTSTAVSGLVKGKTYYVRMRTYKSGSGSKVYSDWSASKSVKVSK